MSLLSAGILSPEDGVGLSFIAHVKQVFKYILSAEELFKDLFGVSGKLVFSDKVSFLKQSFLEFFLPVRIIDSLFGCCLIFELRSWSTSKAYAACANLRYAALGLTCLRAG